MTPETLEESILWRLSADALQVFYSRAPSRHARSIRDVTLVTSGEPVTDLNYLMIGSDSEEAQAYIEECVDWCDARSLPFATMVTPEAAAGLVSLRERLALDYVTDWPLMPISQYCSASMSPSVIISRSPSIPWSRTRASCVHPITIR